MTFSAEDVVIQKLRWGREKDIADARSVLTVNFEVLDWDYLRHWTSLYGTTPLLEKLRDQAAE